jgi:hypothetical protein
MFYLDSSNLPITCTHLTVGTASAYSCPDKVSYVYNTNDMIESGGPALAVNNITPNMTSQFNLATKSKESEEFEDSMIILLNRTQIWRVSQSEQDEYRNKLARIYDLNI